MNNRIELNEAAVLDLSEDAQVALRAFIESKSDQDLSSLITLTLADFAEDIDPTDITDDTNFISGLGLDSLAITEFVFFFEDVFTLKISNDDLGRLQTVGEMKNFILKHLS